MSGTLPKKINKQMLEDDLTLEIEAKIDTFDADNKYRAKAEPIHEDDLDAVVRVKLNNGGASGDGAYDDTVLRQRIMALESNKADKTELGEYFNKANDCVSESMLDDALKSKIDTGVGSTTIVHESIEKLTSEKADKADLEGYREKADKIVHDDLDAALRSDVDNGSQTVRDRLQQLERAKADMTVLEDYRKESEKIADADLESGLSTKINTANDAIPNLRRADVPIQESDLDDILKERLNQASGVSYQEFVDTRDYIYNNYLRIEDAADDSETKLDKDENLGDLTNPAAARNNLALNAFQYTQTIAAGGNWSIAVSTINANIRTENLLIQVYVKDNESGSRTAGRYINSEAVATVAVDGSRIYIYNDHTTALEFKIMLFVAKILPTT